jgi:hypothetical protein
VQEHHASASASAANVVCPNVLELGIMTGTDPRNPAEVLTAARQLLDKGPRLVLVKHLAHAGLDPDKAFLPSPNPNPNPNPIPNPDPNPDPDPLNPNPNPNPNPDPLALTLTLP